MSAVPVFEYHLVGYRRMWRGSVFSSFVLPLLTVLGFGLGVGAYVTRGVEGVPYLDWVVPGLLASTAVQTAFGESTWPVLGSFEWGRLYFAQAASPLRVTDILGGHLAFVVFRAVLSTAAFLVVAGVFGVLHSPWAAGTLPLAVLLAAAVAAPTFAYAASVHSDSYLMLLMRFAVLPMSLFSGVFFPVASLPTVLRWLAYASPLWHGVELCRDATLGRAPGWSLLWHLGYLAAWAGAGWWLAHGVFRRRLVV
jgi:lipooligosaccharide transport system permease protein